MLEFGIMRHIATHRALRQAKKLLDAANAQELSLQNGNIKISREIYSSGRDYVETDIYIRAHVGEDSLTLHRSSGKRGFLVPNNMYAVGFTPNSRETPSAWFNSFSNPDLSDQAGQFVEDVKAIRTAINAELTLRRAQQKSAKKEVQA